MRRRRRWRGWCSRVELRHREHVLSGLERAPEALNLLLRGENSGKTLVEVDSSVRLG